MKKYTASYLYFFSGILFAIASIIYFSTNKKSLGIVYICLAITFISLRFSFRKKKND